MRQAIIKYNNIEAGILEENDEGGFVFTYHQNYVLAYPKQFISFQMPVRTSPYYSTRLFPFFDGLIPEGWLLNITAATWRIHKNDRMGLLLAIGQNCIGAVSVHAINTATNG